MAQPITSVPRQSSPLVGHDSAADQASVVPSDHPTVELLADRIDDSRPLATWLDLASSGITLRGLRDFGARELSAISGAAAGTLAIMAGTAALIPGQTDVANGLAAAAGVAGATSSTADYFDHRSIRQDLHLPNNTLKDRAIDAGLVAGALSAGAALVSMIPSLHDAALTVAEFAGGAALIDGVLTVYDHHVNDTGFTSQDSVSAKTFGATTKGLYGLSGALAGILANVPGAQFAQGLLQGLSGLANAYHSVRMEQHDPDGNAGSGSTGTVAS